MRCITRGRPGTEIDMGPDDDLESMGVTTGDILQVRTIITLKVESDWFYTQYILYGTAKRDTMRNFEKIKG